MNLQPDNLDLIEQLMLEADQAARAGVFGRTRLEAAEVEVGRASWFRRHRQALVGLPVAACLAFVAVIGTLHHAGNNANDITRVALNTGTSGSFDVATSRAADSRQAEVLFSCFSGPGQGLVSSECKGVDYDSDGDVDLVDFGALQLGDNTGP